MKMLLMIYGRVRKQVDDSGLFEMEAITLTISQKNLDELTLFLREASVELGKVNSGSWHRHIPIKLSEKIGGDLVIMAESGSDAE